MPFTGLKARGGDGVGGELSAAPTLGPCLSRANFRKSQHNKRARPTLARPTGETLLESYSALASVKLLDMSPLARASAFVYRPELESQDVLV